MLALIFFPIKWSERSIRGLWYNIEILGNNSLDVTIDFFWNSMFGCTYPVIPNFNLMFDFTDYFSNQEPNMIYLWWYVTYSLILLYIVLELISNSIIINILSDILLLSVSFTSYLASKIDLSQICGSLPIAAAFDLAAAATMLCDQTLYINNPENKPQTLPFPETSIGCWQPDSTTDRNPLTGNCYWITNRLKL